MKKILNWIFGIIGVLAIATCVALAIKLPSTFSTLGKEMGLVDEKVDETSDKVQPLGNYLIDFTSITSGGSGYKQGYITGQQNEKKWYCSSGNVASPDASHPLSFCLGWNDIKTITNGSYDFYNSISPLVSDEMREDGYKIAYILMDFDFYQNHDIEFQVKPLDSLTNSSLQLISSKDNGSSWKVDESIDSESLTKSNVISIKSSFESKNVVYKRYGLLLTSKLNKARLEINSFLASAK